jgi:molybdopterin converting factor small subunit
VATIRLFAAARVAAGTGRDTVPGATVGEVLDHARDRYGTEFVEVLRSSQVWCNGEPADLTDAVGDRDEVAVLPPVSGGAEAVGRADSAAVAPARGADRRRRNRGPHPDGLARSLTEGLVGGYDTDGPRVRLGVLWAVVVVVALYVGPWAFAVVLAVVAGAAGSQTAAAWRRVGDRANPVVAGLTALLLPLAAALGTASLGLAAIVAVLVALLFAGLDRGRRRTIWADGGLTLRCGYPVGLAAGALVVIRHIEIGAAVSLVLLVFAYDLGDFLVGTEAASPVEGPIAGIVAALVIAFALGVFAVPPFALSSALVFGGLAAALFPLGQLAATELLPATDARAPALRRLDSLILVAPLWMALLWRFVG